jgi:hypothetical protein
VAYRYLAWRYMAVDRWNLSELDRRVDVNASATASASEILVNLEGNEAPEDVPKEMGGAS